MEVNIREGVRQVGIQAGTIVGGVNIDEQIATIYMQDGVKTEEKGRG